MRGIATHIPLALLFLLPASAWSDERNRFADVLALQEAVRQAIERAEPSIACILVSRSEKYLSLPARPRKPGELGRYDPPPRAFPRFQDENDPEYQALRRLDLSNPDTMPESYGSGVVIGTDDRGRGLVLTLAHVIRKATKIYVRLPGGRGSWADIHAADPRSDLAVLHLIDAVPNLKVLKLGDGSKLRKGDFILSLSNPFAAGFRDGSPSASWGIVSNLRRRASGLVSDVPSNERNAKLPLYRFNTLIQTDARMNLGCSGGAILNLQGELVGITSSFAGIAGGETPGGFAVPLDAGMRRIIKTLLRGEEFEYGFLGVLLQGKDPAPEGHVRIDGLVPGGPAAQGGINGPLWNGRRRIGWQLGHGDYILSINDTPIHNNDELFLAVGMHSAGTKVRVVVADNPGATRRLRSVTLAKFPPSEHPDLGPVIASKLPRARGGLRVDWSSVLLPVSVNRVIPEGVAIREVLPGSAAANARLQPDMIIKQVNGQTVTTPAEFYREMEKANGTVKLTYGTLHDERATEVIIKVN